MLKCFICGEKLSDIKLLRSHFLLIHNSNELSVYVCAQDNCNRQFQLFNSLRRHILREHCSKNSNTTRTVSMNSILEPSRDKASSSPCSLSNRTCTLSNPDLFSQTLEYQQSQDIVSQPVEFPESSSNVEKSLATFIASLYANQSLPRNVVQTVVCGVHNFVTSGLLSAVKQRLENLSADNIIPPDNLCTVSNSIESLLTAPLSMFDTEHKRINYFCKINTYIKPETIVIGERLEKIKRMGINRLVPVNCEQHFIPLRQVLKSFFSLENVLSETLNYMNVLMRDSDSNAAIENFIQGSYWHSKMNQHKGKIVIPILIFYDDYETGNPLGSHSGVHKLGAVYAFIPCLPPCRSSTLSNIFLVQLFHSADRVKFGNKIIFHRIIEELNYLSDHGIEFNLPPIYTGIVYFELGLILGDNLGIHSITGFIESFSANYPCRKCKVRKNDLKSQCYENKDLLRTTANYESDLLLNNPSETGIKEKCVWLDIKNFDLFNQVGIDIMHDILEGVAKYVMQFVLLQYLRRFKLFTLDLLNNKIHSFPYGPDSRNQPCTMTMEHLLHGNVRMSASEMVSFIRYFSLLVGEFVPRGEITWELYKKLREVLDLTSSTAFAKGTEEVLQTKVADLNTLYMSLTKDSLKPKFHNMVHYHSALEKYGPLIFLWSMRFEAKHRTSKIAANATLNQRNITLTLSKKHQLHMNEIFLKGKLDDVLRTGSIINKCSDYETQFLYSELLLCPDKSLVKVPWATVCSTRYVKDTILLYSTSSDDSLPVFFKIGSIYLYDSKNLIFMGFALQTLEFDDHFCCYEVKEPETTQMVAKHHNSLISPIPCTLSILSNGKYYVTLRFTI